MSVPFRLVLGLEKYLPATRPPLRVPVADLPTAGRKLPDRAEVPARPLLVRHQAALRRELRRSPIGCTVLASMKAFSALSGMRTCRPTLAVREYSLTPPPDIVRARKVQPGPSGRSRASRAREARGRGVLRVS